MYVIVEQQHTHKIVIKPNHKKQDSNKIYFFLRRHIINL